MKADIKKVLYPISAVVLALGLGIGAILLSMLNVQASTEMMPGIEQILDEKSSETPFRILELVNNSTDAEIGYYIAGQEPYLTQYKYTPTNADGSKGESQTFSSIEEGLSVLPTEEQRKEFVQGSSSMVKNPLTSGIAWNADSPGTTQEANYPLSFKSYAEKYFLSKTDDATKWNRVDFKENRKKTLTGHYEENSSGKGDYTKEEQKYYPIREDVDADGSTTQKYRENIKNFFYSDDTEASAPYQLSFEEVDNDDVREALVNDDEEKRKELEASYDYSNGGFGYYENVYGELTSQMAEDIAKTKYTFPGENPVVSGSTSDDATGTDKNSDSANSGDDVDDSDNVDGDNTDTNGNDSDDSDTEELGIYDTDGLKGGEDDEITATENNPTTAGTQANPYIYLGQNIEEHPYYKYTYIGDLEYVKTQAKANEGTSKRKDGDITLEDGQYWYWRADSDTGNDTVLKKEALYIVTGRQAVSESQVKAIPEDFAYNYYYKVKSVKYCSKLSKDGQETDPEDYTYYGWYYASHPSNEDTYIEADENAENASEETDVSDWNTKATHYISEAQYTLTSGKGNYDFVEGTSTKDTKQSVELDHLFYQGGYTNHDWFKHYVFHLDPDSEDETTQKQFENLSIKVDTKVINTNGTGTGASKLPDLSDYDLIYINGKLSSKQAFDVAATTKLPAIINQKTAMGTDADKKVIEDAFAAYIDADYDNSKTSYVSERIYFTYGDLCNLKFYTNFTSTQLDAFSEIADYIKSENNYREVVESGENGQKTEPLKEDISQARVIEYIINYKYKREKAYKSTINVLDIEPASATASLTEDNVRKWLGITGRGTVIDKCCEESSGEGTNNGRTSEIVDGNENTYWHSQWENVTNKHSPHWFMYEMSETADIKGIDFVARKYVNNNGEYNGRPYTLKLEIYDKNKRVIYTEEKAEISTDEKDLKNWEGANKNERKYPFKNGVVHNAKYIKVTFELTYSTKTNNHQSSEFASCAGFSPVYADGDASNTKINITHMTSSEFVGHIDDINTEYDAIYFGDSYNNWNFLRNGDVEVGVNEDTAGTKVSLYSHTGGIHGGELDRSEEDPDGYHSLIKGSEAHRWLNARLMGLLNIDYAKDSDGNFIKRDNMRMLWSPNNVVDSKIKDKVGRLRGSGNDITEQQVKQLKNFVSSGYPIIIGNKLLKNENEVNTQTVDSSSYMYKFLSDAVSKNRVNVMSKSKADKNQNLNFFFYLKKPEISFKEGGIPPEPERLNDKSYRYNKEAEVGNLSSDDEGAVWKFTIKNNSEISTTGATYNCELFFDLNFDGNLSDKEEQSEYIQIQDASGNVQKKQNGKYHLKLNTEYTLTRKIPLDYYKIITWKIQISNNDNPAVRTSRMGFTKRKAKEGEKQEIRVLQIYPKQNVTWQLGENVEGYDKEFHNMLGQVEDFNITIDGLSAEEYAQKWKEEGKKFLDQYQMIMVGFADGYGEDNISNKDGAVDAIKEFIAEGKSVIFAHDTTSFINTAPDVKRAISSTTDSRQLYNPKNPDVLDYMKRAWSWGYSLNTYLRASVGMDRYGITSDEAISVNGTPSTVSSELKKGNDLKKGDHIFEAIKEKVSDMAYLFGNKNTSSFMTQGFSNNTMFNKNYTTNTVTKVNEGAITQYPYFVNDKIGTTTTHSQYYQLALEQDEDDDGSNDIVVWYCLAYGKSGDDTEYKSTPNDVRNNYYFYSKGNVIYTGVGHSGGLTEEEKRLFVNAVIAAARVTAVDPEATFLDDFDPISNQEDYRYYMPDRLKASEVSGTSNILDGDNTFNIRIRDYNMVAPNLKTNNSSSSSLTMELYIDDPDGKEVIKVNGQDKKVTRISVEGKTDILKKYSDGQTIKADDNGKFELSGNDTFQFSLKDMESYLKRKDGTYKECNVYAKVESEINLYGKPANKETWTSISLKPRQLFDLD